MKLKNSLSIKLKSSISLLAIVLVSGFIFSSQTNLNNYLFTLFVEDITGTISVDKNSICSGESATITFEASGGTSPYKFTYTENGVEKEKVTLGTNNSISFDFSNTTPNDYTFIITKVEDSGQPIENITTREEITIVVNPLPTVDFTFNNNVCSGETVQFNSTETGNGAFTYNWDFGDGVTSTAKDPSHVFDNVLGCGVSGFNVRLTVTDSKGCSTSKTQQVSIKQKPILQFRDEKTKRDIFSNCDNTSSSNNFEITVEDMRSSKK